MKKIAVAVTLIAGLLMVYISIPVVRSNLAKSEVGKYYKEGNEESGRNNHAGAIEYYGLALKADPDYVPAYLARADALLMLGRYKDAMQDCDSAIWHSSKISMINAALKPVAVLSHTITGSNTGWNDGDIKHILSTAYLRRGKAKSMTTDYKGALLDFNRSTVYDGKNTEAYARSALIEIELEDYQGALEDINKVISEIKPDCADCYYYYFIRFYARHGLGDDMGGMEDLDASIKLKPSAMAYNDRAELKKIMGNYKGALSDINAAMELEKDKGILYLTRGEIRAKLSDYSKAIRDFDRALELTSANPEDGKQLNGNILYNRGLAEIGMMDNKSAVADLEKASGLGNTLAAAKLTEIRAK